MILCIRRVVYAAANVIYGQGKQVSTMIDGRWYNQVCIREGCVCKEYEIQMWAGYSKLAS
jgi:hypothetical protein